MLLEDFLVDYDFNEVHTIKVQAPPERVFRSLKEITPEEIPLVRVLFVIRSLPALLLRKGDRPLAGSQPMLEQMLSSGFVLLAEDPNRELVVGTVGQFWKIAGNSFKLADVQDFLAFDRPDYAKAVMNFYIHEDQDCGSTRVRTETRVRIPDPLARRKFAAYWLFIKWGSGLMRRMWLRAARQRAEKG